MTISNDPKTITVQMPKMTMYLMGLLMTVIFGMVGFFGHQLYEKIDRLEDSNMKQTERLARIEERLLSMEKLFAKNGYGSKP